MTLTSWDAKIRQHAATVCFLRLRARRRSVNRRRFDHTTDDGDGGEDGCCCFYKPPLTVKVTFALVTPSKRLHTSSSLGEMMRKKQEVCYKWKNKKSELRVYPSQEKRAVACPWFMPVSRREIDKFSHVTLALMTEGHKKRNWTHIEKSIRPIHSRFGDIGGDDIARQNKTLTHVDQNDGQELLNHRSKSIGSSIWFCVDIAVAFISQSPRSTQLIKQRPDVNMPATPICNHS